MVDGILIGGIAWFALAGWIRGGTRSLFDALSWMLSILFITMTVPLFKDQLMDAGWSTILTTRTGMHDLGNNSAIAVFAGTEGLSGRSLYELGIWIVLILLCTFSIFIGFQMIWRIFNVTYSSKQIQLTCWSRRTGALVGTALGLFVIIYLFQLISGLSWVIQAEAMDRSIAGSVLLHSIFGLFPW